MNDKDEEETDDTKTKENTTNNSSTTGPTSAGDATQEERDDTKEKQKPTNNSPATEQTSGGDGTEEQTYDTVQKGKPTNNSTATQPTSEGATQSTSAKSTALATSKGNVGTSNDTGKKKINQKRNDGTKMVDTSELSEGNTFPKKAYYEIVLNFSKIFFISFYIYLLWNKIKTKMNKDLRKRTTEKVKVKLAKVKNHVVRKIMM